MRQNTRYPLALALGSLARVDAFFRINCVTIQSGRIDTLVNPGAVSAHSHTLIGGSSMPLTRHPRLAVLTTSQTLA
jgi:hypothetical protein